MYGFYKHYCVVGLAGLLMSLMKDETSISSLNCIKCMALVTIQVLYMCIYAYICVCVYVCVHIHEHDTKYIV